MICITLVMTMMYHRTNSHHALQDILTIVDVLTLQKERVLYVIFLYLFFHDLAEVDIDEGSYKCNDCLAIDGVLSEGIPLDGQRLQATDSPQIPQLKTSSFVVKHTLEHYSDLQLTWNTDTKRNGKIIC